MMAQQVVNPEKLAEVQEAADAAIEAAKAGGGGNRASGIRCCSPLLRQARMRGRDEFGPFRPVVAPGPSKQGCS
jgi:hypothetical protein